MSQESPATAASEASRRPLHAMFTKVPRRYDLVNRTISLGMDERWREAAARACLEGAPRRVLDLCCGTGDLAVRLKRSGGAAVAVAGLDYSRPMLEIARRKAAERGLQIDFVHADAAAMPFPDGHFDRVGISFAFRNLTFKNPMTPKYLAETLRILRPGGRLVIVESSQPRQPVIRGLYHLYMRAFVAGVGGLLSGERAAYRYLGESAARFYGPDEVARILKETGFAEVRSEALLFGAVRLFVATKAG
ncbi:MAG: ubiquinone/menaquinone biosynthesis methyltransferase [Myxococcales bacterium]|jgi:demethylmenaquinone methyltransferase/2-methoxy-6-polyprenyl-1,4-benzoquinol methylase